MLIPVHRVLRSGGSPAWRRATAVVVAHAIVDDDMEHLAEQFWTLSRYGYAWRKPDNVNVWMHHQVVGRPTWPTLVSHENANKLDNRRANLRICSCQENRSNPYDAQLKHKRVGNFRGVFCELPGSASPWRGKVQVGARQYKTPRCATEEEAAALLNELRRSLGLRVREEVRT